MKRFRFRLESIREWRQLQLELEETKLQRLFEELRQLGACRAGLEADGRDAACAVLSTAIVEAQQLVALEAYRLHLRAEVERLRQQESACGARIAAQRQSVRKAERDLQLLEKLKQRRLAEWEREADKEQETLAAEVFLAKWRREQ
jgi:hypothetical protein